MEVMGSEGELSSGYKLVPWSSWDQWNFVRESIFSSSPDAVAAALRRISAWRSRGCLPVPIDVTAAFVEIQQKDPFFSKVSADDVLTSEEMLAMLYSMAIMRLVNGFVEPAHKKTGHSISELADAAGIPRVLVDIRHESSHRDLPSLRLVRLASVKALDWLKSNYWEPQKKAIPDVRKEIRSRLCEMVYYLKSKHAKKLSSETKVRSSKRSGLLRPCSKLSSQIPAKLRSSKSDGHERHLSKNTSIIARLYSVYPSEVVSVLLEFFQLQAPESFDGVDMEHSDNSDIGDDPLIGSMDDLKMIITKLSRKKPRLLLSMLKTVLEMVEVKESMKEETECWTEQHQVGHLWSLIHWLLKNLNALKDMGQIVLVDETQVLSTDKNSIPKVSLLKLLRKCLMSSVSGDKHLSNSILLLAELVGDSSLKGRLKKLPQLALQDSDTEDPTYLNVQSMLLQEEGLFKREAEKLELLKLRLSHRNNKSTGSADGYTEDTNTWNVAKSWIPCPIGMLPCSLSSTAVLPVLDNVDDKLGGKRVEINQDSAMNEQGSEKNDLDCYDASLENGSAHKKLRPTIEGHGLNFSVINSSMEGRLLIDGIWKKVSEEELLAIESNIRIFV